MGTTIDSRIKTSDVRIPLLWTESKVRAAEHSSLVEECQVSLSLSTMLEHMSTRTKTPHRILILLQMLSWTKSGLARSAFILAFLVNHRDMHGIDKFVEQQSDHLALPKYGSTLPTQLPHFI